MPPYISNGNASSQTITEVGEIREEENEGFKVSKERKEVLFEGYFYDVTDFIGRHPGGNVIRFYTEKGEDASQAIAQFHFRSMDKVSKIMKSFKKRQALPEERGMEARVLTRHEALTKDFNKLTEELKAEGYFDPSLKHVFLRLWECTMLIILGYAFSYECETYFQLFLASLFLGFAYSRLGWFNHEGGHNSLTGWPKVDKWIQVLGSTATLGISAIWWNSHHNRHHAMPNRLQHDMDLDATPYALFHPKVVKEKKEINPFFVRYQAFLYFTLDLFLVVLAWRFFIHPRYQFRRGAYLEFLIGLPSLYIIFTSSFFFHVLTFYWSALFLATNFSLNHTHLEVAEKPTHWIEYGLTHTANISSNIFVDCWMGYLNYQIEHHLFPTMPQFRHKEITHRVKALAEKYDLPYYVYTYPEAVKAAFKNMDKVGKELTSGDYFKDD